MQFRRKMFTLFFMAGLTVFLIGRISSPTLQIDKTLIEGIQISDQLQILRSSIAEKNLSQEGFEAIDAEINLIEDRLELILVEARKRHLSKWRTDVIALSIVIIGVIASIISSWRSDVTRLVNHRQ